MAEGGIEKRSIRTVLGTDDGGVSTSETYDLVVKDYGIKSGLRFESVCITPVAEVTVEDLPEKTVQVMYTEDSRMQGNLKFATVAVSETPRVVADAGTVSRTVHLRFDLPATAAESGAQSSNLVGQSVFASDPDALGCVRFGDAAACDGAMEEVEEEEGGIFASDPEVLKFVRFESTKPKPGASGAGQAECGAAAASNAEGPEEIFASDPEALKYIRFGPPPAAATQDDENSEIFASDPEALKYIRFGPSPGSATAASAAAGDEPEIFASDSETLKLIQFGAKPVATCLTPADDPEPGLFVSDPEALKYIRLVPKSGGAASQAAQCAAAATSANPSVAEGKGSLLAEASGIQLKDDRSYSVRVTGHDLPDGQKKKFVAVRSSGDGGCGGAPTQEEIDSLQVTVETTVGEDGLVEKFVVVE